MVDGMIEVDDGTRISVSPCVVGELIYKPRIIAYIEVVGPDRGLYGLGVESEVPYDSVRLLRFFFSVAPASPR